MGWAWLGALAIGLSLGLLGSGGSILTVPVLLYLAGEPEKLAIAESLAIVGCIATTGVVPYALRGLVVWRSVAVFGIPGMIGAWGGATLGGHVSAGLQLTLFALTMVAAAVLMLRPARLGDPGRPRAVWKVALDGLAVGVLTGLVGVGGGFMIVPALVLLGGLPMQRAVGTSLAIIALKSATGFITYLDVMRDAALSVDWSLIAMMSIVGAAGSLLGMRIGVRASRDGLRRVFAGLLIVVAAWILIDRLPQLLAPG